MDESEQRVTLCLGKQLRALSRIGQKYIDMYFDTNDKIGQINKNNKYRNTFYLEDMIGITATDKYPSKNTDTSILDQRCSPVVLVRA